MKKLLLLLLCVTLMFSCGENKNSLTRGNIKGNVKEIIETTFYAKEAFGEPQKGDLISKTITKYNEDGNMNENTYYNADGELIWKNKYQYDKDGNRTVETRYNTDGEKIYFGKFKYNEDNKVSEVIYFDESETELGKIQFKYNEEGNINEEIKVYQSGMKEKIQFEYDSKENIKKKVFTQYKEDDLDIEEYEYRYDKKGNMTEEIYLGKIQDDIRFEKKFNYEFDENNNWIKLIKYVENDLDRVTEREIEYYE